MEKNKKPLSTPLPPIDLDDGLRRFSGNWDILRSFIHRFIELHEGIEQRAWRLYHEENFTALANLAHKLKGAAGNLSAVQLQESARELETALNNESSRNDIEAFISTIAQQLDELRKLAKEI